MPTMLLVWCAEVRFLSFYFSDARRTTLMAAIPWEQAHGPPRACCTRRGPAVPPSGAECYALGPLKQVQEGEGRGGRVRRTGRRRTGGSTAAGGCQQKFQERPHRSQRMVPWPTQLREMRGNLSGSPACAGVESNRAPVGEPSWQCYLAVVAVLSYPKEKGRCMCGIRPSGL